MIRATAFATALTLFALPASAQSTFERLEALTVTMNGMMFDAMIAQTPALEGNMPSVEWSDDLRAAYVCMYDGFEAQVGAPAMAAMVTEMEQQLETLTPEQVLNGGADVENPAGLSDAQAAEIVADCGMMDAFMTHMSSSGALQILMQDG